MVTQYIENCYKKVPKFEWHLTFLEDLFSNKKLMS